MNSIAKRIFVHLICMKVVVCLKSSKFYAVAMRDGNAWLCQYTPKYTMHTAQHIRNTYTGKMKKRKENTNRIYMR